MAESYVERWAREQTEKKGQAELKRKPVTLTPTGTAEEQEHGSLSGTEGEAPPEPEPRQNRQKKQKQSKQKHQKEVAQNVENAGGEGQAAERIELRGKDAKGNNRDTKPRLAGGV